ncbi:hypothetical protein, partial [uncultured Roseobacter sp.]|uniref:hypothetical protein n=1 Tax=uncultured Roseobacter sp. TaxID=114847 RepID=UPI00260EE57B
LCSSGKIRHGRVTKTNQPPEKPVRFIDHSNLAHVSFLSWIRQDSEQGLVLFEGHVCNAFVPEKENESGNT